MSLMTTGQVITESLLAHGVDTVFGIPGAHMYDFNDALAQRQERLRFITTRHEQGAGYMAYGYAKSTGKVGTFTVVPGPGVLNSGAALCTAYGANAPVLCVTGNIMSYLIGQGRGQLHELPDQLALLRGLTKWSERINHPTEASQIMAEAFRQVRSGRVRPVAVEAPWDVFGMKAEVAPVAPLAPLAPPTPDPDAIAAAAKLIAGAKRPLICVGAGALAAGDAVLALAKLLQAPVTSHRSGKGIVSEESPYGMSPVAAWDYWRDCDLLLGIGSRLELQYLRWRWFPSGLKVVRIDIDPTEMVRLRPDVGIVTDAALGSRALLAALEKSAGSRAAQSERFGAIKQKAHAAIQSVAPQMAYLNVIRAVLPRDGFYCEEISQVGFTSRFGFPVYQPRQYVTCGYQDNLGYGFNTALGVKVANPDKAVVAVSGDGGFLYGAQELATAVQYGINLVTIVFNNGGYGNVRRDQIERYAGRLLGAELRNPDFVKLAESFGALAFRVDTPEALRPALERALAAGAPAVIEVRCPPGSETSPWTFLHPAAPAGTN
ncbi:MAG: thiamine pyrophosphate-dependent enzyme [Steroidobacteraceae bacterium]